MPESGTRRAHAGIALGSNLTSSFGDREANLRAAIERVGALGTVVSVSKSFDTEPVGYLDQPRFLNAALLLETPLEAAQLLRGLLAVEESMGRRRDGVPAKGPRVIDLDLLWMDGLVVGTPELTLPHPGMAERRFVLEPLAEIAPDWVHPVLNLSVLEMLNELRTGQRITR